MVVVFYELGSWLVSMGVPFNRKHTQTRSGRSVSVTIFISFTGFFENVHPATVIDAIAALRRHLVAAGEIERVPGEQPVVAIGGVRIVNVLLQFALVQVGHFAVEGRGLGA